MQQLNTNTNANNVFNIIFRGWFDCVSRSVALTRTYLVCVVVDFPKGYLMTWLVLLERKEGEEEKKMKPADLQSPISHKKRKHSAV